MLHSQTTWPKGPKEDTQMSYLRPKIVQMNPVNTPPFKPIRGREADMVPAAGSTHYVFSEDPFTVLNRFLILGTESSTLYESAEKLTDQNTDNLEACLRSDPKRAIDIITDVSVRGAGIKNDTAVYALAVAASSPVQSTRALAFDAIPKVCRTGTHFLMFVAFCDQLRGWGTGFKAAVWGWYANLAETGKLDYQLAKYRNREGWTHRDVFRMIHKPVTQMDPPTARLIGSVVRGQKAPNGSFLELVEEASGMKTEGEILRLLRHYPGATWEMLPTEALNFPGVWEYFVDLGMPITALVRNLNRLTAQGLLATFSPTEKKVIATLTDEKALRASRIHPLNLLIAKLTYASGQSVKGSSRWVPMGRISDALEEAFIKSFDYAEPTGKNYFLGLDVSGSMGYEELKGIPGLTPAVVTACMSLALVKAEANVVVGGFADRFVDLNISKTDTLSSAISKVVRSNFGATDCTVPVRLALAQKIPVDTFLVMTDGETNCGPAHAANELKKFRSEINPKAKMVMAAMTATDRSITDPKDPLSLAITGFDPSLPRIVQEFSNI